MKIRLTPFVAGLGALVALVSCGEPESPSLPVGTVDVVAYVDMDASNSLTSADQRLSGLSVSLYHGTELVATQTTGSDGHAIFENVLGGSYRVELSGGPAGAALTTNPSPSAVVDAPGDTAEVDFRFVYFPGSVSGVVYRDDNDNQTLDPTDTRGAGLWVWISVEGSSIPFDSVLTGTDGSWSFDLLPPGTYTIEFENPPTISYGTSGATRTVEIGAREDVDVNVTYTGSLILTIAEARTKTLGTPVAVEGNITVPPGRFSAGNSEVWIQDATGGIAMFSIPAADSVLYPLGRAVGVTGTLGAFSQQLQISSPVVTDLGTTDTVDAAGVSGAQIAALTRNGQLVVTSPLTVDSMNTPSGSGAFTVYTTHSDGTPVQVRVPHGNTGLVQADFTVGQTYSVTGILTQFNATPQIKVRYETDVVAETPTGPLPRIVITELMPDPTAVLDDQGEYFEIYNAGPVAVDLQGWTFVDGSSTATPHTITGLTIQPGDFFVFSLNADPGTNGGITVDQQYAGIFFNNTSADRLVIKNAAGITVDSVAYTSRTAGAAFGVIDPYADNADMHGPNWQLQTTVYSGSDRGTPGAANDGWTEAPQIVINEFMANPNAVVDGAGEYIELYNAGGTAVILDGWTLSDNFGSHTISSLTIQPGSYLLFGLNADPGANGGLTVDQVYPSTIGLANGGDRIQLRDPSGVTVDSIAYSSGQASAGTAMGVLDVTANNADATGSNWAAQTSTYGAGDRGTPRARNDGQVFPRPRLRSSAPSPVSGTEDPR